MEQTQPKRPGRARGNAGQGDAFRFPMPLMYTPFKPGALDEVLLSLPGDDYGAVAQAEAAYFRGRPEEAARLAEPYLSSDDVSLRVSACMICGYSSLSLCKPAGAFTCLKALARTRTHPDVSSDPRARASFELFAASACVLLHLPPLISPREFMGMAPLLPEGLRLFASYALAHRVYLKGEYGRCVGMAENALYMKQDSYPIAEMFLHLMASIGWINLRDEAHAREHFLAAWEVASPDGLIEEFGEHQALLQGMVESCLRRESPADYARIIEIAGRFSRGWRGVHNYSSGATVAANLTTTEFVISMLACRGWSNAEIARHMGISAGTVKNRLSSAYAKLGVKSRAGLKEHMLR